MKLPRVNPVPPVLLVALLTGLVACAPREVEEHEFEGIVRCELPRVDTRLAFNVFSRFSELEFKRKENAIAGWNGTPKLWTIVAVGTRKEGISEYLVHVPDTTIVDLQELRDDRVLFRGPIDCQIKAQDTGTSEGDASYFDCTNEDAECSIQAWTEYPSDTWLRL